MAKAINPLQEQQLKAGLVKKSKVAEVAREQAKARNAKSGAAGPSEIELEAQRARAEKAARDRALEAERKVQAQRRELQAQARQIERDRKLPRSGALEYLFTAGWAIRTMAVDEDQCRKLASGALVIAAPGERYELMQRVATDQVRQRDAS